MSRFLVLGDARHREVVAARLEEAADAEVVDCDPALGDCVMYVRLEAARYEGFVFVGYHDPVTRGAYWDTSPPSGFDPPVPRWSTSRMSRERFSALD